MRESAIAKVGAAVMRIFRQQRQQARGGRERFADWNSRLATALTEPIARLYLQELRAQKAGKALADDCVASARARAIQVAAEMNATTGEWLQEGRDEREVFSEDRAARAAVTEASHATHEAFLMVAHTRGQRVRWVVDGNPCAECRSLNRRVVTPGQQFVTRGGIAVYGPPVHPHCFCTLKAVG